MDNLYAPWRSQYVKSPKPQSGAPEECVFCTIVKADQDNVNFVLYRYEQCAVLLNRFPYNAGHMLIIPYAHTATIFELEDHHQQSLMKLMALSEKAVMQSLEAPGINIGINLGIAAGASIADHLHIHVLPRWVGDTNFLPTLAQTKHISVDMNEVFEKLKNYFNAHPV